MRESEPADEAWKFERRSALKLTAGLVTAGAFVGSATADEGGTRETVTTYRVKQGDRAVEIEPLSGDEPVEELYDLRIPDQYETVGASDPGHGPYWRSVGTEDLQRESTTVTFLYDGPNGLSLVVVHDEVDDDGGGSVSWEIADVPKDADWIVMDDYYANPDTGEPADTNYDRWDTDGTDHAIDWTWGAANTDGGVLGYFDEEFSFTIHPAFNEKAALYGEHYEGKIENWEVLSGDLDSPDRISLDLDAAVTVSCTTETEKGDGDEEKGDGDEEKGDGDEEKDDEKSDEEKRREEIDEKQDELEEEIADRREETEEKVERRREEIEARKTEMESEAEERYEEIAEKAEKRAGGDESETETKINVSERFESDVAWNSSDDE